MAQHNVEWVAARAFTFKNLTVVKGGRLPDAWQHPANVTYLKQHYGKGCVVQRSIDTTVAKDEDAWVPCRPQDRLTGT